MDLGPEVGEQAGAPVSTAREAAAFVRSGGADVDVPTFGAAPESIQQALAGAVGSDRTLAYSSMRELARLLDTGGRRIPDGGLQRLEPGLREFIFHVLRGLRPRAAVAAARFATPERAFIDQDGQAWATVRAGAHPPETVEWAIDMGLAIVQRAVAWSDEQSETLTLTPLWKAAHDWSQQIASTDR